MLRITFLLTLLCQIGISQITNIKLFTLYETNLKSSINLEKEDRELRSSWMVDLQVKRINVTMNYRLQMTRHKEHSFQNSENNEKWSECLYLHRRQIRKNTKDYYSNESECLTTTTMEDKERTSGVEQVEREIRKWRKGYKYLVNTCKADHFDDEAVMGCLVEYMEKDNYNQVIQRLIILKLEAMGHLYLELSTSLANLEECLRSQLSAFLDSVRLTMETLNKCYTLKTQTK